MNKTKKEILTDAKVAELLKVASTNAVMYYNFDSNRWNTSHYLGYDVWWQGADNDVAKDFKALFEKEPEFADVELAACMIMATNYKYLAKGMRLHKPVYSPTAKGVVFNVIRRDKQSGRILPVSDVWIGGDKYANQWMAVQFGVNDCMNYKEYQRRMRAALLTEYGRTK